MTTTGDLAYENPLNDYRERTHRGHRHFSLHPGQVVVEGKQGGVEFRTVVLLSLLSPEPGYMSIRDKAFQSGVAWSVLGTLLSFLATFAWRAGRADPSAPWFAAHVPVLLIAGLVMTGCGVRIVARTYRRVRYATFTAGAGAVLLDVAEAGPQRERFSAFVDELSKQVAFARGSGSVHEGTKNLT